MAIGDKVKKIEMGPSDYKELAGALRRISFFANLSLADLESLLGLTALYEVDKGRVLFRKGSVGDALYVIQSGEVDIISRRYAWIPGGRIARLRAGDFFGEMALLDQPYRTASAVAAAPSRLFVLLAARFNELLRSNPAFAQALRSVAARRGFEQKH